MLSFRNRLPKDEISQIVRYGTRVRSNEIEMVYKKTTGIPRFAFIISTKIDKRATARNRMRRIMSESVRHLLVKIKPIDGIIIAQKNFADFPQIEVEKIVRALLGL